MIQQEPLAARQLAIARVALNFLPLHVHGQLFGVDLCVAFFVAASTAHGEPLRAQAFLVVINRDLNSFFLEHALSRLIPAVRFKRH